MDFPNSKAIITPARYNHRMIEIRRIRFAPDEVAVAKQLIYRVAHTVFNDSRPLEKSMAFYESRGELKDMDDIQKNYFDNDGIFLVMTDGDQIIGTGAIRKLEDNLCKLKRLWLLTEYQGKGLGYRMIQELFSFAKENGYERIRLETDPVYQQRAMDCYKRIGFHEIPRYSDNIEDIVMEMAIR